MLNETEEDQREVMASFSDSDAGDAKLQQHAPGPAPAPAASGSSFARGQWLARNASKAEHHHGKKAPLRQVHKKSKPQKSQKRRTTVVPKARSSRASSSSKSLSQQASSRTVPVADPFPNRVINPLLELPSTTTTTTHDLHQLVSLIFAPPDTYSIAYLARLLGWQLPLTARSTQHISWTQILQHATPLLNQRNEYTVMPKEGTFYQSIVAAAKEHNNDDDDYWLDKVDPMYSALLTQRGLVEMTAVTATQHLKIVEKIEVLQAVLDNARELGVLKDEWTIQSLRDYQLRLEREQQQQTMIACTDAQETPRSLVSPTLSGLVLQGDGHMLTAHYEFQWYPLKSDYEMILCINDFCRDGISLMVGKGLDSNTHTSLLVLVTLVLEQARACCVWYALCRVPKSMQVFFMETFGMTARQEQSAADDTVCLVCDIHKNSSRLIFLKYLEAGDDTNRRQEPQTATTHRWLARLPNMDDVAPTAGSRRPPPKRINGIRSASQFFTHAPSSMRQSAVCVRAILPLAAENPMQLLRFDQHSRADLDGSIEVSSGSALDTLSIDLMRDFDMPDRSRSTELRSECQLYHELKKKQDELARLERGMEPKIRNLMGKVIRERKEYEEMKESQRLYDEQKTYDEYKKTLERRKELEQVWQEQLEQDMDAVCDVCNDGEVTPDNQILFCESCNVAVHQMCYGIDTIPDGDYYCIPCRYLGRDKREEERQERGAPSIAAAPLPVCCELCPRRQGALLQSKSDEESEYGKWVHAVCAKWQGLDYVRVPDLVEDVKDLKTSFRRLQITCYLCEGARGAMIQCRVKDCEKWLHVTCARAVGVCDVVHGEDVCGAAKEKAWSLACEEHSSVITAPASKNTVTVEHLKALANQFPPEPEPVTLAIAPKPFDTANGEERRLLLLNRDYENELVLELSTKRAFGLRCEVCDVDTESGGRLKCRTCGVVVCGGCSLDVEKTEGNYRCPSCCWAAMMQKVGDPYDMPCCIACFQPGGFLREAFAKPVSKKGYWSTHKKEFERSLFGRPMWIHSLCAMWHPKPILLETGKVNLSDVVMSAGKQLVRPRHPCLLCGQKSGLTVQCGHADCSYIINGERLPSAFHVTCARQCGLEVGSTDDGSDTMFVMCYRHGGNEYNLRARLEDLIEIEKKRAGPTLIKADQPMKISHATRLMHSAFLVMRMLGWAWRWAELWVDYDSTWEVLLEAGQHEEDMTQEELKIVKSTRESRCTDARQCRLASFGAAIRNRSYDAQDGADYEREAFKNALRSILETKSLVGPLQDAEIEFYVQWLSLAYWSKAKVMGLGPDKVKMKKQVVAERSQADKNLFCYHIEDGTPKFELGNRLLPGSSDALVVEPDDFMRNEISKDANREPTETSSRKRRSRSRKKAFSSSSLASNGRVSVGDLESNQTRSADRKRKFSHVDYEGAASSDVLTPKKRGRKSKIFLDQDDGALNTKSKFSAVSVAFTNDLMDRSRSPRAQEIEIGGSGSGADSSVGKGRRRTKQRSSGFYDCDAVAIGQQLSSSPSSKRRGRQSTVTDAINKDAHDAGSNAESVLAPAKRKKIGWPKGKPRKKRPVEEAKKVVDETKDENSFSNRDMIDDSHLLSGPIASTATASDHATSLLQSRLTCSNEETLLLSTHDPVLLMSPSSPSKRRAGRRQATDLPADSLRDTSSVKPSLSVAAQGVSETTDQSQNVPICQGENATGANDGLHSTKSDRKRRAPGKGQQSSVHCATEEQISECIDTESAGVGALLALAGVAAATDSLVVDRAGLHPSEDEILPRSAEETPLAVEANSLLKSDGDAAYESDLKLNDVVVPASKMRLGRPKGRSRKSGGRGVQTAKKAPVKERDIDSSQSEPEVEAIGVPEVLTVPGNGGDEVGCEACPSIGSGLPSANVNVASILEELINPSDPVPSTSTDEPGAAADSPPTAAYNMTSNYEEKEQQGSDADSFVMELIASSSQNYQARSLRPRRNVQPSTPTNPPPVASSSSKKRSYRKRVDEDDSLPISKLVLKLKPDRVVPHAAEHKVNRSNGQPKIDQAQAVDSEEVVAALEDQKKLIVNPLNATLTIDGPAIETTSADIFDAAQKRGRLRGKKMASTLLYRNTER